jgi:hypothetical protein
MIRFISAACVLLVFSAAASADLRTDLEAAYKSYQEACTAGDLKKVEATMTARAIAERHNKLISAGMAFDEKFVKTLAVKPEPGREFLEVREKGLTAGLIYVREIPDSELSASWQDRPVVGYQLLRFVREDDRWKVDQTQYRDYAQVR